MLKTVNYAVFKCTECGNVIKVNPSQLIYSIECDCVTDIMPSPIEPTPIKNKPKARRNLKQKEKTLEQELNHG